VPLQSGRPSCPARVRDVIELRHATFKRQPHGRATDRATTRDAHRKRRWGRTAATSPLRRQSDVVAYIADETVDLVYLLIPSFNSNATYNVLFAEKSATRQLAIL